MPSQTAQPAQATPMPPPMHDTPPPGLIDIAEAAAQANRSIDQIRRLIRDGRLQNKKKVRTAVGEKWFVDPDELAAYYGRLGIVPDLPMQAAAPSAQATPMPPPMHDAQPEAAAQVPAEEADTPRRAPRRGGEGSDASLEVLVNHLREENVDLRQQLRTANDAAQKLSLEAGEYRGKAAAYEELRQAMFTERQRLLDQNHDLLALVATKVPDANRVGETLDPEKEVQPGGVPMHAAQPAAKRRLPVWFWILLVAILTSGGAAGVMYWMQHVK